MIKKKMLVLSSTLMVGIGSVLATSSVNAESINTLRNQQQNVQEQKSGVQSSIKETEAKIAELQEEQEKIPFRVTSFPWSRHICQFSAEPRHGKRADRGCGQGGYGCLLPQGPVRLIQRIVCLRYNPCRL